VYSNVMLMSTSKTDLQIVHLVDCL